MKADYRGTVVYVLLIVTLLCVLLPASLVFAVDPCHVFHKPWPEPFFHGYSLNARCQNAGLINNYLGDPDEGFDAVFTGTSLSNNFISSELAKSTGAKRALKLVMQGSSPLEQMAVMQRAFSFQGIRHIYWEFFPQQFLFHARDSVTELIASKQFPAYLFNSSRLDDYQYIFNATIFSGMVNVLLGDSGYEVDDPDYVSYWDDGCPSARLCTKPFISGERLTEMQSSYSAPFRVWRDEAYRAGLDFGKIDEWFLPVLMSKCNLDVTVDIYVPPLSYWWFSMQGEREFDFQLYALRHVLEETRSCKNVRVFAFNDQQWIAGDLAHYRDPRHFFGDVHHYIIDSIGKGKHLITLDTVESYEKKVIDASNAWRPWASTIEQMRANARY